MDARPVCRVKPFRMSHKNSPSRLWYKEDGRGIATSDGQLADTVDANQSVWLRVVSARFSGSFDFAGDGSDAIGGASLVSVAARRTANAKAADDLGAMHDGHASCIGEDVRQICELWSRAVGSLLDER